MAKAKWYTHINRQVIDRNRKLGENAPPIKCQHGKRGKPIYGHAVEIRGPSRVVYSAVGTLLPCGARLVIESDIEPVVI